MNTINEEDKKKIEDKAQEYARDHSSAPDKETPDWIINDFKKGGEFGYILGHNSRDAEVERLRKELNNALSVKVNEQAIKQIVNRPGIVSKICANEIRKNETLESELAALKKQVEEMRTEREFELAYCFGLMASDGITIDRMAEATTSERWSKIKDEIKKLK